MTTAPVSPAPRRRDPEARRRAILEAAAELTAELGSAGLTHRAIAARANVSLGSTTQYFASIDELREKALQLLADEIDVELASMRSAVDAVAEDPSQLAVSMHRFLQDRRAVLADIALLATGVTDPGVRTLAHRWYDRFVAMLSEAVGPERAAALAVYFDGATIHAGLHEQSLTPQHFEAVIRAILAMRDPAAPTA